MFDSLRIFSELRPADQLLDNIFGRNHENSKYIVATFHRQQNLEDIGRLNGIVQGLNLVSEYYPVVIPMHPRLRSTLTRNGLLLRLSEKVKVVDPVSYVQMLALLRFAAMVITDSGGLQKEAFFLRVPCVTVRDETEWLETVALGWNRMTIAKSEDILRNALEAVGSVGQEGTPYGSGDSAKKIAELIISFSAQKG
jgi:UDP-GlcNAc3NAcA epimerase